MSKFFINHPIPAIVLSIILTLVGTLAALRLPIAEYPDIAPPTVFVSTSYIGADASVVNNNVAQIIEDEVNGAGNIDFMHSTVDTGGNYELSIVFKQGTDIDTAAVRVQNKISAIVSDLPAQVQAQGVTVNKNTPESVFMFDLISPNGSYDSMFMKNYATIYFLDKIQRVDSHKRFCSRRSRRSESGFDFLSRRTRDGNIFCPADKRRQHSRNDFGCQKNFGGS